MIQGYALIEYENYEEAMTAIKTLNGTELFEGYPLSVDWAFCKGPFRKRNPRKGYNWLLFFNRMVFKFDTFFLS